MFSSKKFSWKPDENCRVVRFTESSFDYPELGPLQTIIRDPIHVKKIKECELGVLSAPASFTAQVKIMHPNGFENLYESRSLAIQSKYFRRHLSQFPSPRILMLPANIPMEGLAAVLSYLESGELQVEPLTLAQLLCAASRLEITELQRRLEQYLRALSMIDGSYFLMCWDICYRAPGSVQLRCELRRRAAEIFDDLYRLPEWPRMSDHLVRQLFLCPDLNAPSAMAVYEAALSWICGNPNVAPSSADKVMSAVPFKSMSTIDRLECLEKANRMKLTSVVKPRIQLAQWQTTDCHGQQDKGNISVVSKKASTIPITMRMEDKRWTGSGKPLRFHSSIAVKKFKECEECPTRIPEKKLEVTEARVVDIDKQEMSPILCVPQMIRMTGKPRRLSTVITVTKLRETQNV